MSALLFYKCVRPYRQVGDPPGDLKPARRLAASHCHL